MTLRTLQIGVTGLRAEGEALGVVGDNIANVNTTGYKRQRELFQDILNRNGGASGGSGAGVRNASVDSVFSQGALSQTGMASDLAITGNGFFVVAGKVSGMQGNFYTRAGEFHDNASGVIVTTDNLALLGRTIGADGTLAASVGPLTLPTASVPAHATEQVSMVANLDASAAAVTVPWDVATPNAGANLAHGVTVYDSLGAPHPLSVYFTKTADGQWEYHATADGDELDPAQPGIEVEVGSGSLQFSSDGLLADVTTGQALSISFSGATPSQPLALDFGVPISAGGSGLDGTTQFSMPSAVSLASQDGYASGSASGFNVLADGSVEGLYTNGRRQVIGQVMLAQFRSQAGLARAGSGLFAETSASGQPALGAPGASGRGLLSAGSLETSNVDLAQEFVGMIRHQRAFGANSKVISTADDLLASLMSLKQ